MNPITPTDNSSTYDYANLNSSLNTDYSQNSSRRANYHPNPNNPAYILGANIRLAFDSTFSLASYTWQSLASGLSYMDKTFTTICTLFPGAQATSTESTPYCEMSISLRNKLEFDQLLKEMKQNNKELKDPAHNSSHIENLKLHKEELISRARNQLFKKNHLIKSFNELLKAVKHDTDTAAFFNKHEAKKANLQKKVDELIVNLGAGTVIGITREDFDIVKVGDYWAYSNFQAFQKLAESTGGIMGFALEPNDLTPLIGRILEHIQENAQSGQSNDVALVLDTTSRMKNDIDLVKKNLVGFLEKAMAKRDKDGQILRFALLEYRDQFDADLNRIDIDFTSDIDKLIENLSLITVDEERNEAKAIFDVVLAAKDRLTWGEKTKRSIILIGDARPHARTVERLYNEKAVTDFCKKAADVNVFVYPILT